MKEEKQKYCGVGGQAVMEGVMMRNGAAVAVSVRRADGSIFTENSEYRSICKNAAVRDLPLVRGCINFIDSLILGYRTLERSSEWLLEDEEAAEQSAESAEAGEAGKQEEKKASAGLGGLMIVSVILAVVLSVGLFMVLPVWVASWFKPLISSAFGTALLEGIVRVLIFLAYLWLISLMKDIRRVFMYHGAEHKCINCLEHDLPLTVENVRASSRRHKRCGTSFLLFVMIVSIFVSIFLPREVLWIRILSRILMLPVVVSLSYELIRLAGRYDNAFTNLLSMPGLWLQGLTTREPEDDMIEVAIASVEAVFDWKQWQEENFGGQKE